MNKVLFPKKDYVKELGRIFKSSKNSQKLVKTLSKYHEKDIAEAITLLTPAERQHIYNVLDEHMIAEIFSYLDDAKDYLEELSLEKAARVVSYMDSDDAVDVLDDLSETKKNEIVEHLDADAKEDVQKLLSYEDDEIGSCMTNNFICIPDNLTIREAMSALVKQAGEHDNISTIYVVNSADKFAGAIDLKDLIIARQNDNLADIISSSYPYVYEHENINECIDKIADYEEDSIPVLTDDGKICGILTATDIVELVDDAMSDDYAKLAGLTSEDDLSEPTLVSIKKRLPWLIILLFLGMAAGYFGGAIDWLVGMASDTFIAFPFYLLVIVIAFASGAGSHGIFITYLLVGWLIYCKVARGQSAALKNSEWIAAAKILGYSDIRILFCELLPNIIPQAIVLLMTDMVGLLVIIVTLGYLGIGISPPTPDWGTMISEGQTFMTSAWWLSVLPGMFVVYTGVALSFIGDGLADRFR